MDYKENLLLVAKVKNQVFNPSYVASWGSVWTEGASGTRLIFVYIVIQSFRSQKVMQRKFTRLTWPKGIMDKVIGKHGIQPLEVEQAVFECDKKVIKRKGDRLLIYSQTPSGRPLLVVLETREVGDPIVITAREQTERERSRYKSRI